MFNRKARMELPSKPTHPIFRGKLPDSFFFISSLFVLLLTSVLNPDTFFACFIYSFVLSKKNKKHTILLKNRK
jgi:hypothetical protein